MVSIRGWLVECGKVRMLFMERLSILWGRMDWGVSCRDSLIGVILI